jgi:type VI protein secretion system component VasK
MTTFWFLAGFLLLIVWLFTVVDLVRRHLGAKQTAAWLLIVTILPFAGAIAYWAMRKPSQEEFTDTAEAQQALREEARRRPVSGV